MSRILDASAWSAMGQAADGLSAIMLSELMIAEGSRRNGSGSVRCLYERE